jgi:hypothetical protein
VEDAVVICVVAAGAVLATVGSLVADAPVADAPLADALVAGARPADVTAALDGALAADPVVEPATTLPPSALEFDVQAAVASRPNDSSATVARRPHGVVWAAVRMLILEICAGRKWCGGVERWDELRRRVFDARQPLHVA